MKLSVICTAYNTEQYIEESLESILSQTFQDFELILVNDGSTDRTGEICNQYKKHANFIVLHNETNLGIPKSRNIALKYSQGEYIAIHDSDDTSLPHRFKTEIDYFDSHPNLSFIGSYAWKINTQNYPVGILNYPPIHTSSAINSIIRHRLNPIIDPTSMFCKRIINEVGCYSEQPEFHTVQDFEFWCRLIKNGHHMKNIPEPLICYRINPNGVTQTKKSEMLIATKLVCNQFNEWFNSTRTI